MATKRPADVSPKTDLKRKKLSGDEGERFRFLLVGKTGHGKSCTGNTLLGRQAFTTQMSFDAVTDKCELESAVRFGNITIDILDSPGLFDPSRSHEEVSSLVMQEVACMHPGPDAIFYVYMLGRYTEEEFNAYSRLKALFDQRVTRYMIILFTHGDNLKGKNIEDLLKSNSNANFAQVLKECGGRYVVFDNTLSDPEPQIQQLLKVVRQLKQENGHEPYKCPKYAEVEEMFEEELNKRLAVVEKKELQNKKYVKTLSSKLHATEKRAEKEKKDFEEKEKKRQKDMKQRKKEMDRQCKALAEKLEKQELSEKQREKKMEQLKQKFEKERENIRIQNERDKEKQAEEVRRLEAERERRMVELKAQMEEQARKEKERHKETERQLKEAIARAEARPRPCRGHEPCTIL